MVQQSELLTNLNPEQRHVVMHGVGPLKVVAGAGTGKTGTLTKRFAYLVGNGVPADRILALTFSRRAAGEFRDRVLGLLDSSYRKLWISTFHTFCLRVLREEREIFGSVKVMAESEQRRVLTRAIWDDLHADHRSYYVGESGQARLIEDALTLTSRAKDEGIGLADFAEYADARNVERLRELANVYLAYAELCRAHNRVDFGDLAVRLVERFEVDSDLLVRWRDRFDYLMVDEFQDTNESQWRLLTLLTPPPHGNFTVVGDGCQAIYAFRGASSRFFASFQEAYPGAEGIVLASNYRSRQHILSTAHALIQRNVGDGGHSLQAQGGVAGEPVRMAGFVDEDAEADYIARSILGLTTNEGYAMRDCAILCRSTKQSARPLARALTAYGVPFGVRGYDPAMSEALDDLAATLRCIDGSATWADAARVLVRRQVAMRAPDDAPVDALAQRYARMLGPNKAILRDVPPLDSISYALVTDWLDGVESWRSVGEVREDLPPQMARAREALDRLEAACAWMRTLLLGGQVYAAMALVGRLDPGSTATAGTRAGMSACWQALRMAHAIARQNLGITDLLAELRHAEDEDRPLGETGTADAVPILTLHSAKGLEWRAVFIAGCAAGRLPAPFRLDRAFDLEDLGDHVQRGRTHSLREIAAAYEETPERERATRFMQEERRLLYVGCTRARERLVLTYARSYDRRSAEPSPFLAELQLADPGCWEIDEESDTGVMLPLDVARSTRQQALAALGVTGRPTLPAGGAGSVVGSVMAAQYAAARIRGGVPIRFRTLPRPFIEDSALTVSFSGLNSYETCARQYFYGQVLHVEAPARGANVTLGTKLHGALNRLNGRWMETGVLPTDAEVVEIWREVWPVDREALKAAMEDPETRMAWEPGFIFARQLAQSWQRALKQLRRYYLWERSFREKGEERVPVALEHPFEIEHNGHRIDGRIDCILRTARGDLIVDYKSGKRTSALKAETSLQLGMYEAAWRADPRMDSAHSPAVAYYFLTADGDRGDRVTSNWETSKHISSTRYGDGEREALWARIDGILARITANDFAAEPPGGKTACTACAYSGWCEESLA